MLLRNDVEMNGEAIMLFVVIIDKTRIFEYKCFQICVTMYFKGDG